MFASVLQMTSEVCSILISQIRGGEGYTLPSMVNSLDFSVRQTSMWGSSRDTARGQPGAPAVNSLSSVDHVVWGSDSGSSYHGSFVVFSLI